MLKAQASLCLPFKIITFVVILVLVKPLFYSEYIENNQFHFHKLPYFEIQLILISGIQHNDLTFVHRADP